MDAFLSWLFENFPWIAILFIFVGLTAWGTWKICKYYNKLERTRDIVKKLPCSDHKKSLDNLQSVRTTADSISEQVTEIAKWVMHFDDKMIDPLSQKRSPRVMTVLGRNLFEISGAKDVINANIDFLLGELEKKDSPTAYDVENNALEVLLGNLSHPMFNSIKEYIYFQPEEITLKDENGNDKQIRLSLMPIVRLMGLELRDKYLERHPELTKPEE